MPGAWVYILRCADGAYYAGLTRHEVVEARVQQHQAGTSDTAWTRDRRPVSLAWAEHFGRVTGAIDVERRLKGWRRERKEAVIRGGYDHLPWFAKRTSVRKKS